MFTFPSSSEEESIPMSPFPKKVLFILADKTFLMAINISSRGIKVNC